MTIRTCVSVSIMLLAVPTAFQAKQDRAQSGKASKENLGVESLTIRDRQGRARIYLGVSAEGDACLTFLNSRGTPTTILGSAGSMVSTVSVVRNAGSGPGAAFYVGKDRAAGLSALCSGASGAKLILESNEAETGLWFQERVEAEQESNQQIRTRSFRRFETIVHKDGEAGVLLRGSPTQTKRLLLSLASHEGTLAHMTLEGRTGIRCGWNLTRSGDMFLGVGDYPLGAVADFEFQKEGIAMFRLSDKNSGWRLQAGLGDGFSSVLLRAPGSEAGISACFDFGGDREPVVGLLFSGDEGTVCTELVCPSRGRCSLRIRPQPKAGSQKGDAPSHRGSP